MKLRYFEYRKGRVEIIPMIDVMLFLLVFFISVTLQMIPDAGVDLQLPQASQVQHLPHPKVTVNLMADGTMMVKGHPLTPDDLTALLTRDGDPAKTQVTIAADKKVPFQFFITAMDAARKAGVTDIGVAAQPQGPVSEQPSASPAASPTASGAPTPTASGAPTPTASGGPAQGQSTAAARGGSATAAPGKSAAAAPGSPAAAAQGPSAGSGQASTPPAAPASPTAAAQAAPGVPAPAAGSSPPSSSNVAAPSVTKP
jgi:biopolymer transport protein ExbD